MQVWTDNPAVGAQSALAEALAKAQGEMKNAPLNKVNPHFKSKYADLAAVREATIPVLSKNGLSIVQTTGYHGDVLVLKTTLMHVSGASITSEYPLPNSVDKPQQMGSALSYARRYSWAAICGITADEDDDANIAQAAGRPANNGSVNHNPSWQSRYETIADEIKRAGDLATLQRVWAEAYKKHITAMPQDTQDKLTALKDDKKAEFDGEFQQRVVGAG